jgi:hypothetical protein
MIIELHNGKFNNVYSLCLICWYNGNDADLYAQRAWLESKLGNWLVWSFFVIFLSGTM